MDKILTKSQLRVLCIMADDIGRSDVDLAFKIGSLPPNFSTNVIGPLRDAGYVTNSPPLKFGKPKREKELENFGLREVSEMSKIPKSKLRGKPRTMSYINYDKEGILREILREIDSELKKIDYLMRNMRKIIKINSRELNDIVGKIEPVTQVEKIQLKLEKAKRKLEQMNKDRILYENAHKELSERVLILLEIDAIDEA